MKKNWMKWIAVLCCVGLLIGLVGCEPYEPTKEDIASWEANGMDFGSYEYPVMPLTLKESVDGITADRTLMIDLQDTDAGWGYLTMVQDNYVLTNTTKEDMTVTLCYPYVSTMNGWEMETGLLPTMTVDGTSVETVSFTDVVVEDDEKGYKSFGVFREQFDVKTIYGDDRDWSALDATPVTVYTIQYEDWEQAKNNEAESLEVNIYYENEKRHNLIVDDMQWYGGDEYGSFIGAKYGYNVNKTITIMCVNGTLDSFRGKIKAYGDGQERFWDCDITVTEEASTLGQVIEKYEYVFDDYVAGYDENDAEENDVEENLGRAVRHTLEGYLAPLPAGYESEKIVTPGEIASEAVGEEHIYYLYKEVTVPKEGQMTVSVSQGKGVSYNWGVDRRKASDPNSWYGFEMATTLGSNLDFSSLAAEVTWSEGITIFSDNIIPDENGKLSWDKDMYYIYYLPEAMMGRQATSPGAAAKPVIYLYPEEETDVTVKLNLNGELTSTWPKYDEAVGWEVTVQPDGTIFDADGYEYSYLFWEAKLKQELDFSKGFVVSGEDSAEFLRDKLSYMGLTPTEYNEFIVYWAPILEQNPYNLISFQWENYEQAAELEITPAPDNMLRVYMAYQPLDAPVKVEKQELPVLEREGFTVVEWGGNLIE